MNEAFLHYVWKYRLLNNSMFTTKGEPIIVEFPGELNANAGPDFFNAKIKIADINWVGNVEIHKLASDWNLHKHNLDKNYNNVVLHVVYENDECDVLLENGKPIPTLEIKSLIPNGVYQRYEELLHPSFTDSIPCMGHLSDLSDIYISTYLERMAVERLERKSMVVKEMLIETKSSWEECCYRIFARYFGGKVNALPFELLAKSIPLQLYSKIRTSPFQVEALMFGQAGLLENDFVDEYPQKLKNEYTYLRKAYSLEPIEGYLWKFFRIRPYSFPTLRISQFAILIVRSKNLFSKLLELSNCDDILSYLDVTASDYWDNHYHFDKESRKVKKTTGRSFSLSLIINAWIPLLFEYGEQYGNEEYKDVALQLLEQIESENNNVIKLWVEGGITPNNALQSQALLEVYNEYCKHKRCLDCSIGYKILNAGK